MKVNGQHYRTVWLEGKTVRMINQPLLPHSFEITDLPTYQDTARAIKDMVVRGAGAIGATAGFGMAQAQEICRLLGLVRANGKEVWLYGDGLTLASALIVAAADHFVLMPEAPVSLTGLYGETLYFKGLFDMIGVEADVVHVGDYKSAGEIFSRAGPSEPARRQLEVLYDALYGQAVAHVARGRGMAPAAVRGFVETFTKREELDAIDMIRHHGDTYQKQANRRGRSKVAQWKAMQRLKTKLAKLAANGKGTE